MHDPALIEAMARDAREAWRDANNIRDETMEWNEIEKGERKECLDGSSAHLTALCTLRPDIAAVLRGEAAVVPRGAPTPDMRRLIWLTQYSLASEAQTIPASFEMVVSLTERRLNDDKQRESDDLAYRAMLEASPYTVKETPDAR